jgi:hypothetical protein
MDNQTAHHARSETAATCHLAQHAVASVFERLNALRVDVERLHREASGLLQHIAQRDDSPENRDLVMQLDHVVENLWESIDYLSPEEKHADSCAVQGAPAVSHG